jgi:hypothetical protein
MMLDDVANLELVRSRRRTVELRVFPDGRAQVRAPQRMALRDIEAFVRERRDWLAQKQAEFAQRPTPPVPRFEDGAEHWLLGRSVPLRVIPARRRRVGLSTDGLQVMTDCQRPDTVERLLENWYRAQARVLFEQLIDQHFPFFQQRGYPRPLLTIRKMRSRWGSLSSRGGMSLNLLLLKAPLPLVEYVVIHELCHLQEQNHGAGFKALMDELLPDWKQRRQQLNGLTYL